MTPHSPHITGFAPAPGGINITKLLIFETGTYEDQFRRAYHTNLDPMTMQNVVARVAGSDRFVPQQFASMAGSFIQPQATPEKQLHIPHGWSERRARFVMELVHTRPASGTRIVEVITGWTDHLGVSGQLVDPQLQFYVNSTTRTRTTQIMTPSGWQNSVAVVENSHVLADNTWNGIATGEKEHRMRPEDVYATMHRMTAEIGDAMDMRSVVTSQAIKSRRGNSLPAGYMSSILDMHRQAAQGGSAVAMGTQDVLTRARGIALEEQISADPFMFAVGQLRGAPANNMFTFQELCRLDPNTDNVTLIQYLGQTHQHEVHTRGNAQHWQGSDRDTLVATMLSQSVPALMMDVALTRLYFRTSNLSFGARVATQVLDVQGFSDMDLTPNIQRFVNDLESTVLPHISHNNEVGFAIEMNVDLVGETVIVLQLDADPAVRYVTPSFADAMMVPVITSHADQAMTLARDFDTLITHVQEESQTFRATSPTTGLSLFGTT